jgi:glycine/D-amino acid oxidase-like deaminating enzyme
MEKIFITSTLSFWERERFFSYKDFIIVGAGLAGLWTAFELKKKFPNKSVLILERGVLPSGASSKNAGFACFGSPTELLADMAGTKEEEVLNIVEMRYRGISKIKRIFGSHDIGYTPSGGYECLSQELHNLSVMKDKVPDLNKKLKSITKVAKTFNFANQKLKTFGLKNFDGLIENKLEGSLDSGFLLKALANKVQEMGVEILYSVMVTSFREGQNGVRIETKIDTEEMHKPYFNAGKMIICTNAFIPELLPTLDIKPARGQMIISQPIANLNLKGTFHFDEGFYYFRNVNSRILIGGARNKDTQNEETKDFSISSTIQTELESFLKKHFVIDVKIENNMPWAGIMGFTPDKKPTIYHPYPSTYALACCNGMGIALCPIMAEQLVKQL